MKAFLSLSGLSIAALLMPSVLYAQSKLDLHFSGFGTLAAVHSDNDGADYTATRVQPNGPGRSSEVSWSTDSRVGAQVNLRLDDRWEVVAQVVAQQQHDKRFRPTVEWLNLGYKVSDSLSVRLGRTALPVYLIADTRYLGYGMPWVRVPSEVYGTLPLTSNDGLDMTWRVRDHSLTNTLQFFAGRTSITAPIGTAKSQPTWGFADTAELGALTMRASYARYKYDVSTADGEYFQDQAERLINLAASVPLPNFQKAAEEGRALKERFGLTDRTLSIGALGVSYDPGPYFLSGEFVGLSGEGYLASSKAWYVSAGLRRGAWTPYVSFAQTKPKLVSAQYVQETGLADLDATARQAVDGLNYSLRVLNADQSTFALGVRWDLERNLALKAQWERVRLGSQSVGRFVNQLPDFEGSRVNVFSVAADYVF